MFLVVLLLLLLVHWSEAQQQQCVYTQNYWRGDASQWPLRNATLCGTPWPQLMQLEVGDLVEPVQAVWLDCFHQCCAASQNLARLTGTSEARALVASLLDLLERACDNVTAWSLAWRYERHFLGMLEQVRALNRGGAAGVAQWPACADEFSPQPPFSFATRTDLFLVRLPNNETVPAGAAYFGAALGHAMTIETALFVFIALSVLLSVLVIGMYCMFVRKHKVQYDLLRPEQEHEETESLHHDAFGIRYADDDAEIDMSRLDSVGKLERV